jgi:hypothetical protein
VIAMPVGQGTSVHPLRERACVNRWTILAPATEAETGALAWAATRVRIARAATRPPDHVCRRDARASHVKT